jgi:acyl-CoA thioester hydrolase
MLKPYFPGRPGEPAPLRLTVAREVRFEEVDPLGIVWHGRYPGYFEDARVALGERYGIGYMDFYRQGVLAPIRKMHVDYHRPLRFRDAITIEGILHWSEAARINYEFVIRDPGGALATTGYTVQMLMDAGHNLLMIAPEFYRQFCARWAAGELA